jgi:inosine-uridine nucleoside N-ribohydrolase
MTNSAPYKVIFDTDPGVDDAIALYFAIAHPEIDILGITTTFGNVDVEQAAANAHYLTALAGRNIPVTLGSGTPWVRPRHAAPHHIHGMDGLGNLPNRVEVENRRDPRSSAAFIVDTVRAHPGEVSLVAVGPLGNLAMALKLDPGLPKLVREVILMGGTVMEPGNVSPVAEANIWNDPHCADIVLTAGWKLTMVGLDVTHKVVAELSLFEKIARHQNHAATNALLHAVTFYCTFYSGLHKHLSATPGCFAHDLLAFIYLVQPELFTLDSGVIRVATEGMARGQTIVNRRRYIDYPEGGWGKEMPVSQVCMDVDSQACMNLFEQVLMANWLQNGTAG